MKKKKAPEKTKKPTKTSSAKPVSKKSAVPKTAPLKNVKKIKSVKKISALVEPEVVETGLVPTSATDPLTRYMAEIRRYPLLTKEEEYELAVKYKETGDREAAQKLVTSNLRFVVKIAMEYSKFGAKMIDLIQEGNMGLMQAVKDFNPYKGVRLITYAVWWIRGHIQEFLMRHYSMVRIGTTHNQRKLFYELQRSRAQLEQMGMEAGLMQISGRLGIPEEEVKEMSERVLNRDVSFDKPATATDGRTTMHDMTSDDSIIDVEDVLSKNEEINILNSNIEKIRPELNEREIVMLDKRILADEPMTLQEIGDQYGITREAARQMEARLIQKIKKQMLEK